MKHFRAISLKNKIFFSILAVILTISVAIAFLARWILISSLTSELELRGIALARSIAESSSGYILDKDYPKLLSFIYDEVQLSERKDLIVYIYIVDPDNKLLSHTFVRPFPKDLRSINRVPPAQDKSVKLINIDRLPIYDIATPIKEGIYRIGTVHVGLSKTHIDKLISKLRFMFLGFISLVIIITFIICLKLSKYITMPITELTRTALAISRGGLDIPLNMGEQPEGRQPPNCPAHKETGLPCWHFGDPMVWQAQAKSTGQNTPRCDACLFYRQSQGDEVAQLADSFHNMVWSIKLYRQRLSESEEKYRSLFDSGPDPIFVLDAETMRIIDANPRTVELYGYTVTELIGRSFEHFGPDYAKVTPEDLEKNTADHGCMFYPKLRSFKKNRDEFYVNLRSCAISFKSRPAVIIAATDVTDMIEKDIQLIQASKMKSLGEMSAGIAHELNQPLNAIKMGSDFLEMVVAGNYDVPRQQTVEAAATISTQVDRAADIISTLRSFGRKSSLVKEKMDINRPVKGVFATVSGQFELDNIKIELALTDNLPAIMAHENRVQQVFFNLVTNARDAIKEKPHDPEKQGGNINIRTYAANGRVFAQISDTGVGIDETVQQKIFEPFFTTKEIGKGMGLGLAITYGIIKDYGGDIQIDSKMGQGTVFTLSFDAVN